MPSFLKLVHRRAQRSFQDELRHNDHCMDAWQLSTYMERERVEENASMKNLFVTAALIGL